MFDEVRVARGEIFKIDIQFALKKLTEHTSPDPSFISHHVKFIDKSECFRPLDFQFVNYRISSRRRKQLFPLSVLEDFDTVFIRRYRAVFSQQRPDDFLLMGNLFSDSVKFKKDKLIKGVAFAIHKRLRP